MVARTGTTVMNRLELKPGSNAAVAAAPMVDAPAATKLQQLADSLGAGIGAKPVEAGKDLGYQLYTIGAARPVVLRVMGQSDSLLSWYRKAGAPAGPNPEFFSINIDWRGTPKTLEWPAGVFVLPSPKKAVHGEANWPDKDAEGYKDLVDRADTDARLSTMGGQIEKHVRDSLRALTVPLRIGAAFAGALVAVYIINRVKR